MKWLTKALLSSVLRVLAAVVLGVVLVGFLTFVAASADLTWKRWAGELSRLEAIMNLLTALAVGVGLWVAYKRSRAHERQAEAAEQGQITERFTKAVEQLGDRERLSVRLGGIYALERIAKDSDVDAPVVFEVLCAFVREQRPPAEDGANLGPIGPDVLAILEVVRRTPASTLGTIDFHGADLAKANLEGAELEGADLNEANLNGADLNGANLNGADLQQADLNLANLMTASLIGADLARADLKRALLIGADLRGARLMEANLEEAELEGANLEMADLQGANLPAAILIGAHLPRADLFGATLNGANLRAANLQGANLEQTDLDGANLEGANLSQTTGLSRAALVLATANRRTRHPECFPRPSSWPPFEPEEASDA